MHIYAYASDNAYLLRSTRVFVSTHQVSIHTIVLEYYAYYAYEYAYSSSSRTMMQRYYAYYYEQYG